MKLLPRNLTHQGLSIMGFTTTSRVLPQFFQKHFVLIILKNYFDKICSIFNNPCTIGLNNTKPSNFLSFN